MHEFYVWVEQDEDGVYVGDVPQLPACYAQGTMLDELMANIREVIALCLEEQNTEVSSLPVFVGVQRVTV